MLDAMSRSLSPMRYYLQGLDVDEAGLRRGPRASADRNRSPTSVHSDPTGTSTIPKRGAGIADDDAVEQWSSDDHVPSGDEDDTDDSIHAVRQGDESRSSSSSESGEDSDAEMVDDDGDAGEEDEEMELFGH
ncbi:hypothetical protein LTR53_019197, partial [Teratosphaeriaceae sp. CCFEE 6253]